MDVKEAILKRRSIRSYKDIPITKDDLIDILVAGQYSPSAGNLQNWRFVIIDDEDMKDRIADACLNQDWMKSAPVFIVICTQEEKMKQFYPEHGHDFNVEGAAAVAQNMMIQATANGLGSCWVGAFHPDPIIDIIGIGNNFKPTIILTLGYSNEKVPCPCKIDMHSFTMRNGWNGFGRYRDINWALKDYSTIMSKTIKGTRKSVSETVKNIHKHIRSKINKKGK